MEMVRKQIYITKDEDKRLKQESYVRAIPETEVVRRALEHYFRRSSKGLSEEDLGKTREAPIVSLPKDKLPIEASLRKALELLSRNKTAESLEIISDLASKLEAAKGERVNKKKELLTSFIGVLGETDLSKDLAADHDKYLYGRQR